MQKQDKLHCVLSGHKEAINCIRSTNDGAYCMTGSEDRSIKLWNPHKFTDQTNEQTSGKSKALLVQSYDGVHGYGVLDIAIAQDKSKFASVGEEKTAYLWDVGQNKVIRRIQAHSHRINAVMFNNHDDSVIFTASYDRSVKAWDLRSNSRDPIQTITDSKDSVTGLAFTSSSLLTSSVDGSVNIYDMRRGMRHSDAFSSPITSIRVSNDEKTFLIACLSNVIYLADINSGKLLNTYIGHVHGRYKIETIFGPTDSTFTANTNTATTSSPPMTVIAGDEQGDIYHWNLLTHEMQYVTRGAHISGKGGISSLCLASSSSTTPSSLSSALSSSSSSLLLTAGYDGLAYAWKI